LVDSNDASWLDFLSNNPPSSSTAAEYVNADILSASFGVKVGGEGVSWERDWPSGGTGTGTPIGNGTTMVGPSMSISSRPPSLSNASGVGAGAGVGVASPKRKSNKQPRVDSLDMDDGLETGKGGKEVVLGEGCGGR
jgi:hypothetical protein